MSKGVCIYIDCLVRKYPGSSQSFFNVPFDNRRKVWLRHCGLIVDRIYPKRMFVCENHFYPKHIKEISIRKLLTKEAFPIPFGNKCSCSEVNIDPLCIAERNSEFTSNSAACAVNAVNSPDHLLVCSPTTTSYILDYNFPSVTSGSLTPSASQFPSSKHNLSPFLTRLEKSEISVTESIIGIHKGLQEDPNYVLSKDNDMKPKGKI